LAPHLHPEFGGFCATSRLRRDIRLVAFSILFGVTAGAVGVIGLRAGNGPTPPSAVEVTSSNEPHGNTPTERRSGGRASGAIQTEGTTGAPSAVAETMPSNGACLTDAKVGGGCTFFKRHRVRVRALNDGPDLATFRRKIRCPWHLRRICCPAEKCKVGRNSG
jgi:hypothetical protein